MDRFKNRWTSPLKTFRMLRVKLDYRTIVKAEGVFGSFIGEFTGNGMLASIKVT